MDKTRKYDITYFKMATEWSKLYIALKKKKVIIVKEW
jgi:hypothetical protein